MDFSLSPEQQQIRDEVRKLCLQFDDTYWLEKDRSGDFPHELHAALAAAGWLGIAMPEEYGGAGLGVSEAAIMMETIAESGAAMSGASAVHINIFGLQPVVVFGTDEQKRRMLPPLIAGKDKACFAVTEPNAGLDTTAIKVRAERRGDDYVLSGQKIWISTAQVANKILILARTTPLERVNRKTEGLSLFYTDLDRSRVAIRVIDKMGRHAVDSNEMFFDGMVVPAADRIGAEGNGFRTILHGMNPERILIAAEAVGIGLAAIRKAASYARERADWPEPGNRPSPRAMLDGAGSGQLDGDEGGESLRSQAGLCRRGQRRQVFSRRGRLPRLRDRDYDPWRHGLFQGIPRRALSTRGHDPADRPDYAAHDPQFHCREGSGAAEVVLTPC
jgi:acyl-CoA dehydrogenase